MLTPHTSLVTLVLLLLLASGLRLYGLDAQSLWFDEGWSAYAAAQASVVRATAADATNPPLYYTLLYLHALFTGHHILVLRWFSFAFGMLSVATVTRLSAQIVKRKTFTLFLAAVNIPLIWASQEMRMYTLLAVLITVLALAWEQLRTQPTRAAWGALALAELAALYTHNTGPVIALWLNFVTLLAWAFHRRPPPLRWIASQVIVGVLWLPYFITRFVTVAGANNALVRRTPPDLNIWAAYWLAPWEALLDQPGLVWLTLPALAALLAVIPWRRVAARWLVLHVLVLTGGLLLALGVLGNELHGRYLVMLVPLVVALAGAGIGRFEQRWVRVALLVPFVVPSVMGWGLLRQYPHDDARGMVQHYAETLAAEDTVLAWSYADRYELAYYWERLGVTAGRVTLPEGADLPDVLSLLPARGDLSLNVWYTQRADYRGMMSCVLGHGTTTEPEFFQVRGMATLTYRQPALNLQPPQPAQATFSAADVEAVTPPPGDFTANQAVCLPISVTLNQSTPAELKAALITVNPLGDEIARADAVFATANQRTSVDGTVGETLTAYPLLRLPYGAPPVEYTLRLRLYDDANLSGYDLLVNGAAVGKDWTVGTWEPQPGAAWETNANALQLASVETVREARNGERVSLTLLWEGAEDALLPTLTLRGEDWSLRVPPQVEQHDNAVLDWRQFQVPLDTAGGGAVLQLPDGTPVARYTITELPLQTEPPSTDVTTSIEFPGVGEVIGYSDRLGDEAREVTLVWRADDDAPANRDYTVFVQVLDEGGQVIAQSDTPPASGTRPTTGWRAGEIIVDTHTLPPAAGEVIFGLYDATGTRIVLANGENYAVAPD